MSEAKLRPDVITYNALLAVTVGVAQQGKASLQDGARVVAKMTGSGTRPDAVTLNTLLEVVAEAARHGRGTTRDAERVMDMMRVAGVSLDMTTFRSLEKVRLLLSSLCCFSTHNEIVVGSKCLSRGTERVVGIWVYCGYIV